MKPGRYETREGTADLPGASAETGQVTCKHWDGNIGHLVLSTAFCVRTSSSNCFQIGRLHPCTACPSASISLFLRTLSKNAMGGRGPPHTPPLPLPLPLSPSPSPSCAPCRRMRWRSGRRRALRRSPARCRGAWPDLAPRPCAPAGKQGSSTASAPPCSTRPLPDPLLHISTHARPPSSP